MPFVRFPDLFSDIVPRLLAQAAESAPEDYEIEFSTQEIYWLVGIGVLLLILVCFLGYVMWEKMSAQAESWTHEDRMFERAMLSNPPAATPAETGTVAATAPAATVAPPEPPKPAATPWAPPPAAPAAAPAETAAASSLDDLISRLQQQGLIEAREGSLALPIPPDAPIYRLKAGGHALLLPRLESEAFMAYQAKRFDMIFALTASGEILSIKRCG